MVAARIGRIKGRDGDSEQLDTKGKMSKVVAVSREHARAGRTEQKKMARWW